MADKRSFGLGVATFLLASVGIVTAQTTPVTQSATVTTVGATPPALQSGVTETLTATIAPAKAVTGTAIPITGTVNFYDGVTLLGMAPVASDVATLAGVALASGVSHSITAVYSGDTNWLTSTSSALSLVAIPSSSYMNLTANLSTVPPGEALILTATVTPDSAPPAGAEQHPSGTVVFYDGTSVIGEVQLLPSALSDSSTATLTTQTQPGGQGSFTAAYLGDPSYSPATSAPLSIDVQAFSIAPSTSNPPTNLNIVQGSTGSASFVIASVGGFTGEIQVVCTVPSQDDMTCTPSPQDFVPTSTVTFVVKTFTPAEGGPVVINHPRERVWPGAAGSTALAVLGLFLLPFGRRAGMFMGRSTGRSARRLLILLLLLAGLGGAGIGCNNVTTPMVSSGTPLGVSTLQIVASANVDNTVVSQSIYLTVNVQPAP